MIISRTTVSAELGLMLAVPDRGSVPLVAGLSYSADDTPTRSAWHFMWAPTSQWSGPSPGSCSRRA
jgi:hypothetical protein